MSEAPSRAASRRGRTLKLYLVDGSPSGVITAELGISSVRAAVASRTALPDLIRREEASRTGGNVSGPRYWRHATTGQTYGDWRKRRIGDGGAA